MGGHFRINDDWLNATRHTQHVEIQEFGAYKYVVDIGSRSGTTAAALSNKMRLGSLVFLVESGFADWWHGGWSLASIMWRSRGTSATFTSSICGRRPIRKT